MSYSSNQQARVASVVRVAAASAAITLIAGSLARATDYTFIGPAATPADYSIGANWSGGVVPGAGDSGFIDGTRIATVNTGFTGSISTLSVGPNGGTGSGELRVTGGSLTAAGVQVGHDVGASGVINVSGGTFTSTGNAVVGEQGTSDNKIQASAGTLNLNGENFIGANGKGSLLVSGTAVVNTGRINDANAIGSTGLISVAGGSLTTTDKVYVGLRGNGVFNLSGGTFTAPAMAAGQENETTAQGIINVIGGTGTVNGAVVLGEVSPNDNRLNVAGGTFSASELYVGANGRGTTNLSDTGTLNIVGQMHIGASGTGVGALNVTGGNLNMTGPGGWILVGQNGQGTFTFSNGAINTKIISVGQDPTSTGTATQTGGTLRSQNTLIVGETSQANNVYAVSAGSIDVGTAGFDPDGSGIFVGSYSGKGTLNISGTASVSDRNGITIGYGEGAAANGTLNLSGGTLTTVNPGDDGRVRIGVYNGSVGNLNITGGAATFAGPILNGVARGGVGIGGTGHVTVGGGTLIAASMLNETGSTYAQTAGTATLGVITGGGSTSVSGGTANVTQITQSSLSVTGTGTVKIANAVTPTASVVKSLTTGGTGKLDLANNGLVVDYTGASPITDVRAALAAGRIVGTITPADTRQAVAYGEASALATTNFLGTTVDATAVLLRSRLKGDTNFSGTVDFPDLLTLAQHYSLAAGTQVWTTGDFNYDGNVDFPDLLALAQNYGGSIGAVTIGSAQFQSDWVLAQSLVPEPTSLLAIAMGGLLARRRRRE